MLWLPQGNRPIWTDLNLLMLFLSVKEGGSLKYRGYTNIKEGITLMWEAMEPKRTEFKLQFLNNC